jgi:hypothetical protein
VLLSFDTMRLPEAGELTIAAGVEDVDNARETVDASGRIRGVLATASLSSMSSGVAVSLGALDPMLLGFTVSVSLSAFRIPESEIILPASTELTLRLLAPLTLSGNYGPIAPPLSPSTEADVAQVVRALPLRTATDKTNVPSDLTNLVFLASRDALTRALDAAGWGSTDPLSSRANYAVLRAIVENQGYREAPMSVLRLDGALPAFTYYASSATTCSCMRDRTARASGRLPPSGPYSRRFSSKGASARRTPCCADPSRISG